jgi:hypothetical protein
MDQYENISNIARNRARNHRRELDRMMEISSRIRASVNRMGRRTITGSSARVNATRPLTPARAF